MKIALTQLNTTVGDLAGNEAKIMAAYKRACDAGAELAIFPELTTVGYPPRDLLLKKDFVAKNLAMLQRLATASRSTAMLIGYVAEHKDQPGRDLTNEVALLQNGKVVVARTKTLLPTYDVFDEDRYFEPALTNQPVAFGKRTIGLSICEDIWNDEDFWPRRRYRTNPVASLLKS